MAILPRHLYSQIPPQLSGMTTRTIISKNEVLIIFIRFGITPPLNGNYAGLPVVTLINNGNMLVTGSGFLEVSKFTQNAGTLVCTKQIQTK